MDHQKNQVVFATWFFCIYQEGNRTKFSVAKRRSIKERISFSLRVRSPSGGRQPFCRFATFPLKGESPRWITRKERRIGYNYLCQFCVFYCFLGKFLPFESVKLNIIIKRAYLPRIFALPANGLFLLSLNL